MPVVLLTRSSEENELESKKLAIKGFDSVSLPMLYYDDLPFEIEGSVSHAIVTSKHAAKLLAKNVQNRLECWVVGHESAKILSSNPQIEVTGKAQNVKELLDVISMVSSDDAKDFFANSRYYSGDVITQELPSFIRREIIYNISYTDLVAAHHIEIIKKSQVKYILVYSKNCAINLMKLIQQYSLLPYLQDALVVAISKDVADVCKEFDVKHAPRASFSSMLELLIENERKKEGINFSK